MKKSSMVLGASLTRQEIKNVTGAKKVGSDNYITCDAGIFKCDVGNETPSIRDQFVFCAILDLCIGVSTDKQDFNKCISDMNCTLVSKKK